MKRTAIFAIVMLLLGGCAAQLVRVPVPANLVTVPKERAEAIAEVP